MGVIYCGPFSAAIDEGTQYGHEGYAAQVLHDDTESSHWVRTFREFRAACACGWRSAAVHPPTDDGEHAALDEWDDKHLNPLIRAEVAHLVVPVTTLLDLIGELRRTSAASELTRPDGGLTQREVGRYDVIEVLEARLEGIAVDSSASI